VGVVLRQSVRQSGRQGARAALRRRRLLLLLLRTAMARRRQKVVGSLAVCLLY
jgi:hypothetical protein